MSSREDDIHRGSATDSGTPPAPPDTLADDQARASAPAQPTGFVGDSGAATKHSRRAEDAPDTHPGDMPGELGPDAGTSSRVR